MASCWAVNRRALDRGHGIRTGMEDVTVLPDWQPAQTTPSWSQRPRVGSTQHGLPKWETASALTAELTPFV
jgi:hypothetical protein